MPRWTRATAAAVLALTVAASAAACGGGTPSAPAFARPSVDQFRTGTCRDAAPTILAIGDLGLRLRSSTSVPAGDRQTLVAEQKRLQALRTSEELADPVRALVTAIGFVRIRIDGNTYDPRLMSALVAEQQRLVASCVDG